MIWILIGAILLALVWDVVSTARRNREREEMRRHIGAKPWWVER